MVTLCVGDTRWYVCVCVCVCVRACVRACVMLFCTYSMLWSDCIIHNYCMCLDYCTLGSLLYMVKY